MTIGEKGSHFGTEGGVSKSLEGNQTYFGSPAEEARKRYKELASVRALVERQ